MVEFWKWRKHHALVLMLVMFLLCQNFSFCWSLNDEGLALLRFRERVVSDPFGALTNWNDDVGVVNPCSWHGIECSDGNVVSLNLKDLCLEGTIAPDLGNLIHIKSIILRNNSFFGIIPGDIAKLKELEVLDLGYNNFSGPLPSDLGNNLSLAILLLDNNELVGCLSPEIYELRTLSEVQVDENQLNNARKTSSWKGEVLFQNIPEFKDVTQRKLLNIFPDGPENVGVFFPPPPKDLPSEIPGSPSPSPSPSPSSSSPSPAPTFSSAGLSPSPVASASQPSVPTLAKSPIAPVKKSRSSHHHVLILSSTIGGSLLLLLLVTGIFICRSSKVAVVKPWATGLSGQLQKAFVTGVPKLKRSELETACEDFSNVIGSSSAGTLYKGTLSSGVEIAVISISVISAKDWSKNMEVQFRKKIETLSKVNHKNFVNLLGYCEEEEPFTRMMVFEYAPNGTLFEHLHIKEAEHLDWTMRMRIVMGMAYCLQHMHQLTPPVYHKNLNSSAVYVTEDYAAKISDFGFWNEVAAAEMESNPESNIYSFGVLLFEIVTGRLPYSVDRSTHGDWASDYLGGEQPLRNMVDPTLSSFQEEQLERICTIMKSCVNPDPRRRPEMREVAAILREVTGIGPDAAIPKLSPLWWAELEILSTEAN
ncbi:probable inactive receptor-like protein kinase At3g56050 isoform X2 [Coffea arabica]|uniref:Probable inactive receptor-like protein kinase At3g56050 isoform X2 n=1 Tax=Coffea arabica TaxID=13443 RepID=A0ABM4WRR7_COFAR